MELLLFVLILCLVIYVIYRNIVLIGRYRHNKEYIECTKEMLSGSDTALSRVSNYIESEKSEEFKNKARIIELYLEMEEGERYLDTLEKLDFKQILCTNGKFSRRQMAINVDMFVWTYLDMAKARRLSRFDVLNSINDKMREIPELETRVEYQLCKAIYNALCEKEDAGVEFLSALLEGGYSQYAYEKNLIGLYKRFAAATLAYSGEPMEEYFKNDLHSFSATQIGEAYMKDLEIYDKYLPIKKDEENKEEVNDQKQEEKKEESAEDKTEE